MKKLIIYLTLPILILSGCGKGKTPPPGAGAAKTLPPPVVTMPVYEKKAPQKYAYRGDRYRDPFISLTGPGRRFLESDEVTAPNIGSLSLKGIISEGKTKIALITGDGTTFVLKDSRLYDNRQRLIRGISGAIKKDSVIMIAPEGSVKELKLREN
ncbi:MAG: hypothetical protein ABII64_03900 [Elusimicrobiota bacterium]